MSELTDKDLAHYSNEDLEDVFHKILDILKRENPQSFIPKDNPEMVILGGIPGSGKSRLIASKVHELIFNNIDDYRVYHPNFEEITLKDPENMPILTGKFAGEIQEKLFTYAIENNLSTCVELSFKNLEKVRNFCNKANPNENKENNKYKITIKIVVCQKEVGFASTIHRNEMMILQNGTGRGVRREIFDDMANKVYQNIKELTIDNELSRKINTVEIYARKNITHYELRFNSSLDVPGKEKLHLKFNEELNRKLLYNQEKLLIQRYTEEKSKERIREMNTNPSAKDVYLDLGKFVIGAVVATNILKKMENSPEYRNLIYKTWENEAKELKIDSKEYIATKETTLERISGQEPSVKPTNIPTNKNKIK